MTKELKYVITWLLENSLYWTIKNWFLVRKQAKREGLTYSGIIKERMVEKVETNDRL